MHKFQEANARYGRGPALGRKRWASDYGRTWTTRWPRPRRPWNPSLKNTSSSLLPWACSAVTDEQMKEIGPGGVDRHIAADTDFRDVLDKRAWFAGNPETTIAYHQGDRREVPRGGAGDNWLPHGRDQGYSLKNN